MECNMDVATETPRTAICDSKSLNTRWFACLHQNVAEERNKNAKSSTNRKECTPRMENEWGKVNLGTPVRRVLLRIL